MMSRRFKLAAILLLSLFALDPVAFPQSTRHEKGGKETVWNYDGGVFFVTDGSLANGVCFRITGRMSSGNFFDGLRRIDTDQATAFMRDAETVTKFPDSVTVSFTIHDQLCPSGFQQTGAHPYMTQRMIDDLRLSIYWKHGVGLRPAKNVKEVEARVDPINPYALALAAELPPRYEWSYKLVVPSASVPITDSLAFVLRAPDGRIAARVSARL
jgi:hypothetical protein